MTEWQQKYIKLSATNPATNPKIQELANAAQDFAKWFAADQRLYRKCALVICGNSGTGKTHTARALYRWARSHSGRVGAAIVWFSWPEACDAITEGYSGVINDMIEADFLALDDIGAETDKYKSGATVDKLCQVLSRRENKFTVITTNVGMEDWQNRLDVRIADRLLRNSVVCDLSGVPSYSVANLLGSI